MIIIAKLLFKYGNMNASKSINLLATAKNLEETGKKVMLLTSAIDTRSGVGKIASRVGIEREAIPVYDDTNIYELANQENPDYILIDEVSLFKKQHILDLVAVVDLLNIDVICYGLLKDYRGELFEGSYYLVAHADKLEEIKTTCTYCKKKATHILKFKNGKPVYVGEQIEIGDNDIYKSVCRRHYFDYWYQQIANNQI